MSGIEVAYAAAAALAVAGTAVQGVSSYQAAKFEEKSSEQQAKHAQLVAEQQAEATREQGKRLAATQLAMTGKSGVAPTSGSPMQVFLQTKRDVELKALDELFSGQVAGAEQENIGSLARGRQVAAIGRGALETGSIISRSYKSVLGKQA